MREIERVASDGTAGNVHASNHVFASSTRKSTSHSLSPSILLVVLIALLEQSDRQTDRTHLPCTPWQSLVCLRRSFAGKDIIKKLVLAIQSSIRFVAHTAAAMKKRDFASLVMPMNLHDRHHRANKSYQFK